LRAAFIRRAVERQLTEEAGPEGPPIWERIEDLLRDIPATELTRLPADGSEQHDHYIYGTPKRER